MNQIAPTRTNAATMESVLAHGDLSKLSPQQSVAYYLNVCESLGLNPYTRPFDFMTFQGKKVLYAKRDCADQLRSIRGITLAVVDRRLEDDLYVVTVRATTADGRSDEDFGAVTIGSLKGEARANAMLKAITKAKRRVTLSICGLGMADESEVDSIPGATIESVPLHVVPETPEPLPAAAQIAYPQPSEKKRTRIEFARDKLAACFTHEDLNDFLIGDWEKAVGGLDKDGEAYKTLTAMVEDRRQQLFDAQAKISADVAAPSWDDVLPPDIAGQDKAEG